MQPQTSNAKVAQLVEHNLAKVRVAGSSPVFRSQEGIQNVLGTLFNYTDMTLKFISIWRKQSLGLV